MDKFLEESHDHHQVMPQTGNSGHGVGLLEDAGLNPPLNKGEGLEFDVR